MGKLPKFDMEEILTKTMDQFWRYGYSATSIRDLEKTTDLLRGSLYHAFGGKRQMFLRALHHYDRLHRETLIKEFEQNFSPRQAVVSMLEAVAGKAMGNDSSEGCFAVNVALELGAHDEEVASFVAGAFAGMTEFFRASIERGQANGEISSEVDPDQTAKSLFGLFLGLRVLARVSPDRSFPQSIVGQVEAMLPAPEAAC